jgi:hypothetical protein
MGTLFALLLIFGGFGAITGAIKAFSQGVARGRREAREQQEGQKRGRVD